MKKGRKKKKIIATLAATIAGIGVLVSGAFASPEDVINNEPNDDKAIIEIGAREVKKSSFLEKIPLFLRAIIGVPLWIVGHLIMKLVSTLLKITLMPLWQFIVTWLIFFLIVLLIVVICIKILFPDMPLGEILTKKLILSVAGGTLAIMLLDLLLMKFWRDYQSFRYQCLYIMGMILIVTIMVPFIRKKAMMTSIIHDDLNEIS